MKLWVNGMLNLRLFLQKYQMDMKKLYAEKEKEIAKSYRIQAEGLAADAQRKAAVDKVH